mmetsp:Transcript_34534/g.90456  ORF Transcript_34534/g.90456 Transcript_34534/m.90456 type:complete len:878 (-) Transcript_34534:169-2802(-)
MEGAWLEASLSEILPDDGAGPISAIPYELDLNILEAFNLPAADSGDILRTSGESPTPMAPLSPPDSANGWSGASHDGGSSSDSEDPPVSSGLPHATFDGPAVPMVMDPMAHMAPPAVMAQSAPVSVMPTSIHARVAPPVSHARRPDVVPHTTPKVVCTGVSASKTSVASEKQRRKTAHNAIERRYRNSINDKIAELRLRLPDFMVIDATKSGKAQMNKSKVIQKGIEYIAHLEKSNADLLAENERLRQLVPAAAADGVDGDAGTAKKKRIKVEVESGRFLMCVMACGLVAITVTGNSPSMGSLPPSAGAAPGHAGSRVLAGVAGADVGGWDAVLALGIFWGWRLLVLVACAVAFMRQDVVTDPTDALQNEAKAEASEGNAMKQKYHATTALALVGAEPPAPGTLSVAFALAISLVQQLGHRFYVGVWLDRVLSARTAAGVASVRVQATMNHALLHACVSRNMEAPADSGLMRLLLALRGLNAAETAGDHLEPIHRMKAYITVAAQVHMTLQSDVAAVVSDYYTRQARRLYWQNPEAFPGVAWLFRPNGHDFFRGGLWCSKVPTDSSWKRLYPGTFEHLQATYHLSLLEQGLVEIVFGTNTDKVQDVFDDLRESASQCGDKRSLWWGTLGVAHVCWRKGHKGHARKLICELDALNLRKSKIEHFAYATTRAHLALLDGDQQLCWQALEIASAMCHEWAPSSAADGPASLPFERFARLLGHQQLLNTRVALVRLRSYLKQKESPQPLYTKEGKAEGDVEVTRTMMLAAVQRDIGDLRRFSQNCVAASSSLLKYQAIHRSLAGGKVALTEHMFHQSLKSAKQLGLPYEEASTLLHSAVHLHSSMPKQTVRDTLNRAVTIFEQMQAAEELQTSRKLLQLVL